MFKPFENTDYNFYEFEELTTKINFTSYQEINITFVLKGTEDSKIYFNISAPCIDLFGVNSDGVNYTYTVSANPTLWGVEGFTFTAGVASKVLKTSNKDFAVHKGYLN